MRGNDANSFGKLSDQAKASGYTEFLIIVLCAYIIY